jgi:hypothetical protein
MAVPTDDPRLEDVIIQTENTPISEYERNPKGEIKYDGEQAPSERLQVDLLRQTYDYEELRKTVNTEITELSEESNEEIQTREIS